MLFLYRNWKFHNLNAQILLFFHIRSICSKKQSPELMIFEKDLFWVRLLRILGNSTEWRTNWEQTGGDCVCVTTTVSQGHIFESFSFGTVNTPISNVWIPIMVYSEVYIYVSLENQQPAFYFGMLFFKQRIIVLQQ